MRFDLEAQFTFSSDVSSIASEIKDFILKFNNLGQRQWATYYGGNDDDRALSITTDKKGKIYVCGYTKSTDFSLKDIGGGAYFQNTYAGSGAHNDMEGDAFILKFNNKCQRVWATYYGGSTGDYAKNIIADEKGNIYADKFRH